MSSEISSSGSGEVAETPEAGVESNESSAEIAEREEIMDSIENSVDDVGSENTTEEPKADVRNCPVEGSNGHWENPEERGNCKWVPDEDYVPKKCNPDNQTWGQIMEKHNIDGIEYKDGEPDLRCISKGDVEISGFSTNRDDNFEKADIELAKQKGCEPEDIEDFREKEKYTWHECRDQKTMQLVPSEVHSNITHRGGISEAKQED